MSRKKSTAIRRKKSNPPGRPRDQEKFEAFAHWYAQPKSKRNPPTAKEWAEQNDVSAGSTLTRWKDKLEFKQLVLKLRVDVIDEFVPDILSAVADKAMEGELGHAKWLMELGGDYTPRREVTHQHNVVGGGGGLGGVVSDEMIDFLTEEILSHPKMVEMPYNVLREILSDTLMEE